MGDAHTVIGFRYGDGRANRLGWFVHLRMHRHRHLAEGGARHLVKTMGLHDDLKTALATNFNATQRNRVLSGFLSAYHYTKDDGNGNQVPCTLPGDAAIVGDKTVDTIIAYMKDVVRASELETARRAVPEPPDLDFQAVSK